MAPLRFPPSGQPHEERSGLLQCRLRYIPNCFPMAHKMKKRLVACTLFVTCVFYTLPASSQGPQHAPFSLLIQYRDGDPAAASEQKRQDAAHALSDFEKEDAGSYPWVDSKWRTLWTDGTSKRVTNGLVFALREHLYTMIPVWARSDDGKARAKITLTPIQGGKILTILNDEVADMNAGDPYNAGLPTSESIEILSVCGDWFGANVHISDGMRKHDDVIFTTYRVIGSKAIKAPGFKLPTEVVDAANQKLSALPEDDRGDGEPTVDESRFVIVPHGSGIAAEFGTYAAPISPTFLYARVPLASLKQFSSYISTPSFVKTRFGLDSSKYDLLTVSPDKSAVAYKKDRLLYWKKGHEASVSLGKLGEVRGFQWLSADSDTLLSKPTR
jgi:hypothetical protein